MGAFMARLFEGRTNVSASYVASLERLTYKLRRKRNDRAAMDSIRGLTAGIQHFSFLFVYVLQRLQGWLPLNPQGFAQTRSLRIWRSTPPSAFSPTPTGSRIAANPR